MKNSNRFAVSISHDDKPYATIAIIYTNEWSAFNFLNDI